MSWFPSPRPPVPQLAVATPHSCRCWCHSEGALSGAAYEISEYDAEAPPRINGIGNRVVDTRDPLAAAVACNSCRDRHCLALSGRPPELDRLVYRYRPDPTEYRDGPRTEKQGDGDGGEGAE